MFKYRESLAVGAAVLIAASLAIAVTPTANAQATCQTSAQFGMCNYPPYILNNNEWGEVPGGMQTLTATSASSWNVVSNQPNYGGVKTYPEVQQNLNIPIGRLNTVQQWFTVVTPPKTGNARWEVAADDWLNGTPSSNSTIEIMVWMDTYHTQPAGSNTGKVLRIGNQSYDLWANNASSPTYSLVNTGNFTTDIAHIVDVLNFLKGLGYVNNSDTLKQLDFGEEILTTNGPQKWTYTAYHNRVITNP
jgi:hypothetical protein